MKIIRDHSNNGTIHEYMPLRHSLQGDNDLKNALKIVKQWIKESKTKVLPCHKFN